MKSGLIIIDVASHMTSVSLVEDGKLKEHYAQYIDSTNITGNIYKGQVKSVLTGLSSAFVNFGNLRNGFLAVDETVDHKTVMRQSGLMPAKIDAKEGDYIMVQATKEEIGNKGARLTTNITLPGRYLIFLPTLDFIGISGKITEETDREKLVKFLTKLKPQGGGFIARTACLDAKKSEIADEAKRLIEQWSKVKKAYDEAEGIAQIYSDGDLIFRQMRDMLSPNIDAIICNDEAYAKELVLTMKERNIKYWDKVKLYLGEYDMLDAYHVLSEVDKLLEHTVKLDSGVTLVFDYTEALTVIDVNTAKFARGTNHEETVFAANLDAAREIARQIRLRNIGGIIIIDFIDMMDEQHKQAVIEELKKEMIYDRIKTRVIGMSSLGLVEITRKKVGKELSAVLLDKCPFCNGGAHAQSVNYVARKIKARLRRMFLEERYTTAIVTVNFSLVELMFRGKYFSHECETIWRDKRIYLVPDPMLLNDNFLVKGSMGTVIDVPPSARLLY